MLTIEEIRFHADESAQWLEENVHEAIPLLLARVAELEAKEEETAFEAMGYAGECGTLKARVAELEPQPIATAPRTGVLVRAWDRCVGRWMDIRWKNGGWVHDLGDRFEMSEPAYPTVWRVEPDQSGEGESTDE